jgi:hypothetical protein
MAKGLEGWGLERRRCHKRVLFRQWSSGSCEHQPIFLHPVSSCGIRVLTCASGILGVRICMRGLDAYC